MDENFHNDMISVVVPIQNEEEVISEFYNRTSKVLESCSLEWEIIFVEDSSTDNTVELLLEIANDNKRVKVIILSRNFGHHTAIMAGLDFAMGDHIVIMDGDLQHRPEDIPRLRQEYLKGYDIVFCKRFTKQTFLKQLGSNLFNRLVNFLSDQDFNINTSIFRIISKRVKNDICGMKEIERYIPGLISWLGYSTSFIEIQEDSRISGKSKYSFFKAVNLFFKGIISFSVKPLIFSTYIGFFIASVSFIWGIVFLLNSLIKGIEIPGYPSLLLSIFFLGGLILFVLGIFGHYLAIIFVQVKNRPLFVVKNTININKH